ncbi:hypothetical protein CVV65_14825 [Kyrpidia spormannii]|uniref:Copper amine oxidase-like N-terminal domain-containing protein n=1 Tax=Kyrpidia spormannii TaxID=2055160 RepID=A0A2K8N9L5_9BACL|nr:stalk domain-containing protein [Kyrpidia spormannii]ATY86046.1 hypothetical protein CVV65_14825 [Kyrpidia spormannii]
MQISSRWTGRRNGLTGKVRRPGWAVAPLLVLGSCLISPGVSQAAADHPALYVDGKRLTNDVPPYIVRDRVMVPVRAVAESLGASVSWNERQKTATVDRGPVHIEIPIGRNVLYKDGSEVRLDVPAELVRDRTMVPLRAVAEALGEQVNWDGVQQAVFIVTPPSSGTGGSPQTGNAGQTGTSGQTGSPGQSGTSGQSGGPGQNGNPGQSSSPGQSGTSGQTPTPGQSGVPTAGGGPGADSPNPDVVANLIDVQSAEPGVTIGQVNKIRALIQDAGIYDRLRQDLPGDFTQPVHIHLVITKDGFSKALAAAGMSPDQVETFSDITSGAAFGNEIYLPLYVVADDAQIANVLAHELTHVYLDQNGLGNRIPVWFNEGLAWHEGLAAQGKFQAPVVLDGWKKRIEAAIIDGRQKGLLGPLTGITEDLILHTPAYNPEWQGYVALEHLAQGHWDRVREYLTAVKNGTPEQVAFSRVFGQTESAFSDEMDRRLDQEASQPDPGVTVVLNVLPGFSGSLGVLPKGTDVWDKSRVTPGSYQVTVTSDGTISGLGNSQIFYTVAGADPNTMFIGVQPDGTGPGGVGQEGGFAVSYAFGRYFYQNAWSRTIGDVPSFSQTDTILGVQLQDIQSGLPSKGSS